MDAIDALLEYRKQQGTMTPTLERVHRFHRANPQVLTSWFLR